MESDYENKVLAYALSLSGKEKPLRIMSYMGGVGVTTLTEISGELEIDKKTADHHLKIFERAGLIEEITLEHSIDSRKKPKKLTSFGMDVLRECAKYS